MTKGELLEPWRQFDPGPVANRALLFDWSDSVRQPCPLTRDPVEMFGGEESGPATASASRDGQAQAPVVFDAEDIPAGAAIPHEVRRGSLGLVQHNEWQTKLHNHEDT